jgi:hypothetical protein
VMRGGQHRADEAADEEIVPCGDQYRREDGQRESQDKGGLSRWSDLRGGGSKRVIMFCCSGLDVPEWCGSWPSTL